MRGRVAGTPLTPALSRREREKVETSIRDATNP
jgi:hypothetical protein